MHWQVPPIGPSWLHGAWQVESMPNDHMGIWQSPRELGCNLQPDTLMGILLISNPETPEPAQDKGDY